MNIRSTRASRPGLGRTAAVLIGACAAYQAGLGAYFVVFRPSLLPEDLHFLGASAARVSRDLPELERWLDLVFTVLGGQMAALGCLLGVSAVRLMRRRAIDQWELALVGCAGLLSVGLMSAVNFALESDFRWLLILPVLAWAVGLALAARSVHAKPAATREHERAGRSE